MGDQQEDAPDQGAEDANAFAQDTTDYSLSGVLGRKVRRYRNIADPTEPGLRAAGGNGFDAI